jgi:hypothetical protein
MNARDILQALSQKPFKPFRMALSTGQEVPVLHHDTVLFNAPKTTLVAVGGEQWHLVDLQQVAELTCGGQPS